MNVHPRRCVTENSGCRIRTLKKATPIQLPIQLIVGVEVDRIKVVARRNIASDKDTLKAA